MGHVYMGSLLNKQRSINMGSNFKMGHPTRVIARCVLASDPFYEILLVSVNAGPLWRPMTATVEEPLAVLGECRMDLGPHL
jgi:hypothetical protein